MFAIFPVTLLSIRETEFFPSTTTPSLAFAVSVAFLTVMSAVEYIAGLPVPLVTYVPPSTFTVPPPLSLLIAAAELPLVATSSLLAFVVPLLFYFSF